MKGSTFYVKFQVLTWCGSISLPYLPTLQQRRRKQRYVQGLLGRKRRATWQNVLYLLMPLSEVTTGACVRAMSHKKTLGQLYFFIAHTQAKTIPSIFCCCCSQNYVCFPRVRPCLQCISCGEKHSSGEREPTNPFRKESKTFCNV